VPVPVLLVQVLQGLGPVLLGLVPEQVQALVALLGPEPVLAVLLVQVVPAQGGLRVVVVLAACLFTSLFLFSPTSNLLQ
tara:strand:+ start:2726 stop:2962 length:237 start_codon:yes stop_codon:yes gene_type:complete